MQAKIQRQGHEHDLYSYTHSIASLSVQTVRNFAERGMQELYLRSKRVFMGLTVKRDSAEILNCCCDRITNDTVNCEIYN